MHNSEIFCKIKCNKTKNKRSDKNLGSWAESDDQFGYLWALQFTISYYTPNFMGSFLLLYRTVFCMI